MEQFSRPLIALFIFTAFAACKTTDSTMVSTWRNPAFADAGFEDFFVIGVGEDNDTRRLFEDAFARVIVSEGSQAQASFRFLPQSGELTNEEISGAMEGGDFDGVLITTLLSVDEEQQFVPPSQPSQPQGLRPAANTGPGGAMNVGSSPGVGYHRSYHSSYEATHQTGYYETETKYRFRTELYSASTGTMVWRGDSETVNPKNTTDKINSVAKAVVGELKNEKLIQ